MSTEFTNSQGQHVATRSLRGKDANPSHRVEILVSAEEWVSLVWVVSEYNELVLRKDLDFSNCVRFLQKKI